VDLAGQIADHFALEVVAQLAPEQFMKMPFGQF
jgi:hypothetical protein